MAQQVRVGGQPDAGGQAGEGAAGVVGIDRRAPLGVNELATAARNSLGKLRDAGIGQIQAQWDALAGELKAGQALRRAAVQHPAAIAGLIKRLRQ